jgi:hypothetical protein
MNYFCDSTKTAHEVHHLLNIFAKKTKIFHEECILLNIFVKAQTCYAKSQSSSLIAGNKRET